MTDIAADPREAAAARVGRLLDELDPGLAAALDPAFRTRLDALALASDFALDTLRRQPKLLHQLDDPALPLSPLSLDAAPQWPGLLRRWRAAESTRLIWRDVSGLDTVDATLAGATWIAEQCLQVGLDALAAQFAAQHGQLRTAAGAAQGLVVFGLGKLGGGELNFSSDIDLVFAYAEAGVSDGARPLEAEDYVVRLGQRLIRLIDEMTADGFCHRVDMRLRPFGSAGRLALSAAAMEHYFQREGRDWERYAWLKARPVAGDVVTGEAILATLRPFVYRRYLDYGALDGLREMKALIAAEVARRELAEHVKLGPGGIREIEFLAQALQLVRGGREPALRQRSLLAALVALADAGHLAAHTATRLAQAYRHLRRLENRLQMLADQQVHTLPDAPDARLRLALSLGHADWCALMAELDAQRGLVSAEFDRLLAARRRTAAASDLGAYWCALPDGGDPQVLQAAGFADPQAADASLREFARSSAMRALSANGRARLDRVLPALLQAAGASRAPQPALPRLLALLHAIARRTSYLALLDEQPPALQRLVDVTARSALMSERLAAHPLLLDELLDVRAAGPTPDRAAVDDAIARALARSPGHDAESVIDALNEVRQSLSFRVGLAALGERQPASASTRQLAMLAQALLQRVYAQALQGITAAHGRISHPDERHAGGLAVIGYGSLGGEELGFGSDLDLVFLYDAPSGAISDGARPLDASHWHARLAQKLVSLLGVVTSAGHLYDVDVRLRPDGAKGMLVSSVASFTEYQRDRAWTWERQALVRARAVAGDAAVMAAFDRIRDATLRTARDPDAVRTDVIAMRRRMRGELDRSRAGAFDLKQGEGGLVDLEFLLQALVLIHAHAHPALCVPRNTVELVHALADAQVLAADPAQALGAAYELLLARGLECTLDRRPRIVAEDAALAEARQVVVRACRSAGLALS